MITRYELERSDCESIADDMVFSISGEWVRWDDTEKLIHLLSRAMDLLEQAGDILDEDINGYYNLAHTIRIELVGHPKP